MKFLHTCDVMGSHEGGNPQRKPADRIHARQSPRGAVQSEIRRAHGEQPTDAPGMRRRPVRLGRSRWMSVPEIPAPLLFTAILAPLFIAVAVERTTLGPEFARNTVIAGLLSLPAAAVVTMIAKLMRERKPAGPEREVLVRKIRNATPALAVLGWQAIEHRNTAMAQAAREHFGALLYQGAGMFDPNRAMCKDITHPCNPDRRTLWPACNW